MVNWISVRVLLSIVIIHGIPTRSIDFVLAFAQADLDVDLYMELPFGFDPDNESSNRGYVLNLKNPLCIKSCIQKLVLMAEERIGRLGF